jgi:asparagine synthase (glutamine-hydrolysing)
LLELFYSGVDPVDSMLRTHFKSALIDDFLVKVDRSSMAYGLELRSPFLDHNLIEFCYQQIPSSLKVTSQGTRIIQKRMAKSWFPKNINFDRKQGFSVPINDWLRRDNERVLMDKMQGLPEIINMDFVRTLIKGHINGKNNGGRLFSLMMLAASLRNS